MPAKNLSTFEKLFDEIDAVSVLLDEGPDDSESFLNDLQIRLHEAFELSKSLTVDDVDAEFTVEEESNGEEES